MTDGKQRIALLIDADNASATKVEEILESLKRHGSVEVLHAYGEKSHLKPWKAALQAHSNTEVQQFANGRGKNASDIAMVIGAMDLLRDKSVDAFALGSSDADFTPLARRLRRAGLPVYAFGKQDTPESFRYECTEFTVFALPAKGRGKEKQPKKSSAAPVKQKTPARDEKKLRADSHLHQRLRRAVDATKTESGWADLAKVGKKIREKTSFDQRSYGFRQLGDLMEATERFEVRRVNTVGQARYKQAA